MGPKRLLKTQIFEKKKATFTVKIIFWPIFFVVSDMANVREAFLSVEKVS